MNELDERERIEGLSLEDMEARKVIQEDF